MTILGQNLTLKLRAITTQLAKSKPVKIGMSCLHGLIYISEEFYTANTVLRADHIANSFSKTVRDS